MPTELLPSVYDITCTETETGRIRAFLFDDGTLVDCGLPDTTDALLDEITQTDITVDRLAITHADRDHVGGFDTVIQELSPETHVPVGAELDTEYNSDHRYADGEEIGSFETVNHPATETTSKRSSTRCAAWPCSRTSSRERTSAACPMATSTSRRGSTPTT